MNKCQGIAASKPKLSSAITVRSSMYLEQAGKLGGLEKLRLDRLEKLFFIDHESSSPATPVILPGFDEMEFSQQIFLVFGVVEFYNYQWET